MSESKRPRPQHQGRAVGRDEVLCVFAGLPGAWRGAMNSITRLVAFTLGLVLILLITSSWGQPICHSPGCNPTTSDNPNNNTAGGSSALANVVETNAGGFANTAFGVLALFHDTTGSRNTALGALALQSNTISNDNTALGALALQNTIGKSNTATGGWALQINTTDNLNPATGFQALQNNIGGASNTAIGAKAL